MDGGGLEVSGNIFSGGSNGDLENVVGGGEGDLE